MLESHLSLPCGSLRGTTAGAAAEGCDEAMYISFVHLRIRYEDYKYLLSTYITLISSKYEE